MKRLLLCNGEYPPFAGGGGVYTETLAKGVASCCPETDVFVYAGTVDSNADGAIQRPEANLTVGFSRTLWGLDYGSGELQRAVFELDAIVGEFRPDLIHSHHIHEAIVCGIICRRHG